MAVLERIPNLDVTPEQIEAFCRKWDIQELALFGSVLRDDFTPESDVDVWFVAHDDIKITLEYLLKAQAELENMFGRRVDFVLKRQIEDDPNYLRRRIVFNTSKVIYAAG